MITTSRDMGSTEGKVDSVLKLVLSKSEFKQNLILLSIQDVGTRKLTKGPGPGQCVQ